MYRGSGTSQCVADWMHLYVHYKNIKLFEIVAN